MIKRIKRLIALSRLEALTEEQVREIPNAGDGKTVFFREGSQEDFIEQERKDNGMSGWYKRLKNL